MGKAARLLLILGLILLFFLSPLALDIKLVRYKLLAAESAAFMIALSALLFALSRRSISVYPVPALPLALYSSVVLLAAFLSGDRVVAGNEIERAVLLLVICFLAPPFLDRNLAVGSLKASAAALLLTSVFGAMQRFGGVWIVQTPKMHRVMSTFGNPDFFAAFIVISLPVSAALAAVTPGATRLIYGSAAFLGLLNIYYTESRGGMLGLSAAFFFFVSAAMPGGVKKKAALLAVAAAVSAAVLLSSGIWIRALGPGGLSALPEKFASAPGAGFLDRLDFLFGTDRLKIWRDTLKMSAANPLGVGPGAFHIYFPGYASPDLVSRLPQDRFIVNYAHNEYLETLSETGIPALGLLILFMLSFVKFVRNVVSGRLLSGSDRILFAAAASGVAGLFVHNFFDVNFRFVVSWAYLAGFLAILSALGSNFRSQVKVAIGPRAAAVLFLLTPPALVYSAFRLARPFKAQQTVAAERDFFDQRITGAAKKIRELEEKVKADPGDHLSYQNLGWIYAKEIEKKGPDGGRKIDSEAARRAIESFVAAARINPALFGAYNNIGNIFFTLGDRKKAIESYRRSLVVNPDQIDARMNLGLAYYYEGRLKEAADEMKQILGKDPSNAKAIVLLKKMVE